MRTRSRPSITSPTPELTLSRVVSGPVITGNVKPQLRLHTSRLCNHNCIRTSFNFLASELALQPSFAGRAGAQNRPELSQRGNGKASISQCPPRRASPCYYFWLSAPRAFGSSWQQQQHCVRQQLQQRWEQCQPPIGGTSDHPPAVRSVSLRSLSVSLCFSCSAR